MQRGTFITLEGIDGTGKATQLGLLESRLQSAGYDVVTFDFPRYVEPSSYFIKQYLNGAYGGLGDVSPYTESLFYALDRFEAAPAIRAALEEGKIVVANRFSGSSFAHQGAKIANTQERTGFYIWLDNLEFQLLGIPRPTLNIILQTSVPTAQALIDKKPSRSYTAKQRDLHENDPIHLASAAQIYQELAQLFPRDFQVIDCLRGGEMVSPEVVSGLVWGKVEPLLPPKTPDVPEPPESTASQAPTRPTATARLSLLAETRLCISTKLDSSLDPVTPQGERWYYTAKTLKGELRKQYRAVMQDIRAAQQIIIKQLIAYLAKTAPKLPTDRAEWFAREAAQRVLPLASLTTIATPSDYSGPCDESLASLNPDDTALRTIVSQSLSANHTGQGNAITLTSYWPRNELELVPRILYQFSDQPLEQIEREVGAWSYDKKASTLRTYIVTHLHDSGASLLDEVCYNWDLVTDVLTLRLLATYGRDVSFQALSPRLGYDTPKLIEQAGLSEVYERCFDQSLSLYSALQAAGLTQEAQYAVLLGHRVRWTARLTLTELSQAAAAKPDLVSELVAQAIGQHPVAVQTLIPPATSA